MEKIIGDNLNKSEANKLRDWWNANTKSYHFTRKMDNSKFYEVYQQIDKFETGATSAAVNELILYTDNTKGLASFRDSVNRKCLLLKPEFRAKEFEQLFRAAVKRIHKESAPLDDFTENQIKEYCQIYANRFAEWKRERERQEKQSK